MNSLCCNYHVDELRQEVLTQSGNEANFGTLFFISSRRRITTTQDGRPFAQAWIRNWDFIHFCRMFCKNWSHSTRLSPF